MVTDETGKGSGSKDTMLAQLADGEFVTKAKSVLGAGKAMGGKNKQEYPGGVFITHGFTNLCIGKFKFFLT